MTQEFDIKDYRLLYALSQNARQSHTQLAETISLSKKAVAYRINRLKERGVIEKFLTLVNHKIAGYSFYDVFFKLKLKKEQEKEIDIYLKKHPNLIVAYKLSGEWDYLVEIGCKSIQEFYEILNKLVDEFSSFLESFETHLSLETYKVEFLPYEICDKIGVKHIQQRFETVTKTPIILDTFDKQLLYELNRDCTAPIIDLASTLKKSPETIIARIKKLYKEGIIAKFSALVDYEKLGYNTYVVLLDLRAPTSHKRTELKQFLREDKRVRFAFWGASKSEVLMEVVVKRIDELDTVLKEIKERFFDLVVGQKYMLISKRLVYDQFPKGLV